ncbi:MAG: hypothetical protein LKI24_11015 [Acidipropionibacterium sp.]|jgi:hypothetical protein|nr:hypothetical protein [Acidipropionibacterium sp.]
MTELRRAAGVVDVENLLHWQAKNNPYLARQCLTAFVWWARHVTLPAQITEMGGYAQPWDPTYRAVRSEVRALRFKLRDVRAGKNIADIAVCERTKMLVETRNYTTFTVGGIDHLVLKTLDELQAHHALDVWIVAPTDYQRQCREMFAPGGKHGGVRARGIVWIDEVLEKYLATQRSPRPIRLAGETVPSPFLPAARFWSPLMPQNSDFADYRRWTALAKQQFARAGFGPEAAEDLSEALWIGLHAEKGMAYTGRDPLARRDWAKICLATLLRLGLSDRKDISPHVAEFYNAAIESGYQHVMTALDMAKATDDPDAEPEDEDA